MAYYILVNKISETKELVKYEFRSDEKIGYFQINKLNGVVILTTPMIDDNKNRIFIRASLKITKAWKSGYLPDTEEWAS